MLPAKRLTNEFPITILSALFLRSGQGRAGGGAVPGKKEGGGHWLTLVLPIFAHCVFEHVGPTPLLSFQTQSISSHNKGKKHDITGHHSSFALLFFRLSSPISTA